jgi:hypothetical protein
MIDFNNNTSMNAYIVQLLRSEELGTSRRNGYGPSLLVNQIGVNASIQLAVKKNMKSSKKTLGNT